MSRPGWVRRKVASSLLCVGAACALAGAAHAEGSQITLKTALRRAQDNPPHVLRAVASLQRARAEQQIAVAAFLPVISAQGSASVNFIGQPSADDPSTSLLAALYSSLTGKTAQFPDRNTLDYWSPGGTLAIDLPLFSPGRFQAWKGARHESEAAAAQLEDVQRAAMALAAEIFVRALSGRVLEQDAQLSFSRREEGASAIVELVQAGLRPSVDATRAQVEVVNARALRDIRKVQSAAGQAALAAALGEDPAAPLVPLAFSEQTLQVPRGLQRALALASENRPDLKRLEASLAARQQELRAARLRPLPTLGVMARGSMSYIDQLGDSADSVPVGLSKQATAMAYLRWDLDPKTMIAAKAAKANALEAQRVYEAALLTVRSDVAAAFFDVERTARGLEGAQARLEGATATREAQVGRYRAGVASLLDLLDAEQLEQDARRSRIEAGRDHDVARVRLLALCGDLGRLAR